MIGRRSQQLNKRVAINGKGFGAGGGAISNLDQCRANRRSAILRAAGYVDGVPLKSVVLSRPKGNDLTPSSRIPATNSGCWYRTDMKIATWNVNGIRAREAQFCEWLERDRPDVVCLQELKAEPAQIPDRCKHVDYHVYWHGLRAYSGVSLHVRKGLFEQEPAFSHPDFDMESRIVQASMGKLVLASVYVPNGGKDYPAKLSFMRQLAVWAKRLHDEGRELVLCGDMNITRTDLDVHPRERKPGIIGQREEERA